MISNGIQPFPLFWMPSGELPENVPTPAIPDPSHEELLVPTSCSCGHIPTNCADSRFLVQELLVPSCLFTVGVRYLPHLPPLPSPSGPLTFPIWHPHLPHLVTLPSPCGIFHHLASFPSPFDTLFFPIWHPSVPHSPS